MIDAIEKNDQLQFRQGALAEQFQQFCQFLDCQIAAMMNITEETGAMINSDGDVSSFSEPVGQLIAEIVRIGQIIRQRQPELAEAAVRDFQFLLAAWADEVMIKMLGQNRLTMAQQGNVERGIFGTVHAGDEFFHKIQHMLERRNTDDICLAAGYWLALMQGFEGRYIGGIGGTELHQYASALQAISLKKIAQVEMPKLRVVETVHSPVPWFIRIGMALRPKIWLAFSLVLLLCLISLEMHWSSSTVRLRQSLKPVNDLLQAPPISTDQQEMK